MTLMKLESQEEDETKELEEDEYWRKISLLWFLKLESCPSMTLPWLLEFDFIVVSK